MKFKIGGSYGYAGSHWEDEVEAEHLQEAEDMARDLAMERVEYWAMPLDPQQDDEDDVETE